MASLRARLVDLCAFTAMAALVACGGEGPADPAAAAPDAGGEPVAEASDSPIPRAYTAPKERGSNRAPRIVSARLDPERPTPGDNVRVVAEVEDPEGDKVWLAYTWWLDGEKLEGLDAPRLLLRGVEKGVPLAVEIVASDGKDQSSAERIDATVGNTVPEIASVKLEPEKVVAGDQPIVVRPEASDSDGDAVRFTYAWKVNGRRMDEEGATLSTKGLRRGDRVQVSVTATDGESESPAFELPLVRVANAAPVILSAPGGLPTQDGPFYQIEAEDPDGDRPLQYSIEDAPPGMTVNPRTGAIDWTPTPSQVGTHEIHVVVDDNQGGRSRQTIQVSVGETTGQAQPPARSR